MALVSAFAAFCIAFFLTQRLTNPKSYLYLLDHPNERSLHERPTPRGGGLAIAAGIVVGGFALWAVSGELSALRWLGLAAFLVAGVSFLDDVFGLAPFLRIGVHMVAAVLLVWGGLGVSSITLPGVSWSLSTVAQGTVTVLYATWMVNLYNFMDGMDGFAAGMGVIGFGVFALLGWLAGAYMFGALSLVIAAAAGGFLPHNFPPARVFMGDVGSSLLGLLAAVLSLRADQEGIFPLWIGVLIFSPFIVDATVTLGRRLARGERIWEAHRTHFYQRLVRLGWGHRRTVLSEYALMIGCGLSALLAVGLPPGGQWALLLIWIAVYLTLMILVHRLETRSARRGVRNAHS